MDSILWRWIFRTEENVEMGCLGRDNFVCKHLWMKLFTLSVWLLKWESGYMVWFFVLEDALVFNPDVFLDWGWCSMHIASFPISEPPQLVPHPISIHQRLYSLKCMLCIPSPFHQYNMKCNPISIHQRLYSLKCMPCIPSPFHQYNMKCNPISIHQRLNSLKWIPCIPSPFSPPTTKYISYIALYYQYNINHLPWFYDSMMI